MSDDRIRFKAQEVVFEWKRKLDVTRVPADIYISMEDELIELIEDAIRKENELTQLRCMPQ
jgi:hypothetical protein